MNGDKSIMIMGSRSETSYLLINHLLDRFPVSQVIFEAPRLRKMLRYRARTLGYWPVALQLAFLVWDRLFIRPHSRSRIAALLAGCNINPPDDRVPTLDVPSVNSKPVWDLVQQQAPAAIMVTGTGIIGKRLLGMHILIINIHCGLTPRYRGVHGAFWALVEGRPDLAGTTIHVLDENVDTGPIIEQVPVTLDRQDTYRTLPVKQYLAGLEPAARAIDHALDGTLTTYQRSDLESRQWYSPTPLEYLRFVRALHKLP